MSEEKIDALLLELRDLIANKEWATACANMETAHRDGWSCDWYSDVRSSEARIQEILALLRESPTERAREEES